MRLAIEVSIGYAGIRRDGDEEKGRGNRSGFTAKINIWQAVDL